MTIKLLFLFHHWGLFIVVYLEMVFGFCRAEAVVNSEYWINRRRSPMESGAKKWPCSSAQLGTSPVLVGIAQASGQHLHPGGRVIGDEQGTVHVHIVEQGSQVANGRNPDR